MKVRVGEWVTLFLFFACAAGAQAEAEEEAEESPAAWKANASLTLDAQRRTIASFATIASRIL